ncbi:hypothetical protein ACFQ88_00585 [Paenibacillus sp. NPDC056579]|uniref:hypothetical protein n=1 Tax=unclassified Paenibacillus TaxID=185978 RepID=UPI001EF7D3D4|nr:hypothetical protein [Paenibacillus sp. H1-7]
MDKRKVITAYRRGFITMQECAQILGIDSLQVMGMVNEPELKELSGSMKKQHVNG